MLATRNVILEYGDKEMHLTLDQPRTIYEVWEHFTTSGLRGHVVSRAEGHDNPIRVVLVNMPQPRQRLGFVD